MFFYICAMLFSTFFNFDKKKSNAFISLLFWEFRAYQKYWSQLFRWKIFFLIIAWHEKPPKNYFFISVFSPSELLAYWRLNRQRYLLCYCRRWLTKKLYFKFHIKRLNVDIKQRNEKEKYTLIQLVNTAYGKNWRREKNSFSLKPSLVPKRRNSTKWAWKIIKTHRKIWTNSRTERMRKNWIFS